MDAEITGHRYGGHGRQPGGEQFAALADVRVDRFLDEVVGNRSGNDHEQPGGRGQRSRQTARGDKRHQPIRQSGNLRIGQDHDVAVHRELIALRICDILDAAISIPVLKGDQPRGLPLAEPLGHAFIGLAGYRLDEVGAGEGRHGGGRGIQHHDEQQRESCRLAGIPHPLDGEEADDDVGQTRRADHQGQRDGENIHHRFGPPGVFCEAQFRAQSIQLVQEIGPRTIGQGATESQLGNGVSRHLDGNEDRRYHERTDEHTVLGDLRVGDALHPAENGVEQDDRHADDDTRGDVHLEKAGKDDAHPAHLSRDVGEGDQQGAHHRHQPRLPGIVAVTDEIGNGELAEFP